MYKIGILVFGVVIMVDKMVVKVWLEDLEVECLNKVFVDRVKVVVERVVEVMVFFWG